MGQPKGYILDCLHSTSSVFDADHRDLCVRFARTDAYDEGQIVEITVVDGHTIWLTSDGADSVINALCDLIGRARPELLK